MKTFSTLLVLAAFTTAYALPPADCKQPVSVGNQILTYYSQAQFPKESENTDIYFFDDAHPLKTLSLCNFVFTTDTKTRTVSVSTAKLSSFGRLGWDGFGYSSRPGSPSGIKFRVHAGSDVFDSYIVFDPKNYELTYPVNKGQSPLPFTIGVKLSNGALQPLYFNGQAKSIQVPRDASTIDIYVKSEFDDLQSSPRITINPQKISIQIYQDAVFPAK